MNHRRFWIQNDSGVQWSLNGDQGVWFVTPEGLGARWKILTADLGHGFFKELPTDAVPADPVAGELKFLPAGAYSAYRSFLRFVASSSELRLLYCPYGTETYYVRGRFEYLQKGELDQTAILTVPVSFVPFTPWYQPRSLTLTMQAASESDMTFPFTFDQDLRFPSSAVGSWAVEITPAGDQPASLVFEFSGAATNPVLTLTGVNSETEYGRCAVTGTVTGLRYSSQYLDSYVTDGGGSDLMDDVSPGYDPFFRVPLSEPCVLRLQASGELSGSATVSVNYFYRSV